MIHFKKVRWKNLLSSGNKFTTIELDRSSTTLIVGENGAGKSTLLDALCYGLYGKGFRNLKKELLVNSINQKEMLIEIEFSIGKKNYKIIRGTRPNKFELYLGNTMLNQDASVRDYQDHLEKNILKMSHRSFTQVAILGSANFTPFMQLKASERRKLVEDLLDISIFSTMRDILRKKISAHKVDIKENEHEIEILEERINGLNEQINALQKNRDKQILKYEKTVKETDNNIQSLMEKIDEKTKDVVEKESSIKNKTTIEDRLKQTVNLEKQLEVARKKAITDIEFYENHDNCPTCKQGLDHEHKEKCIQEKTEKIAEIKSSQVLELVDRMSNELGQQQAQSYQDKINPTLEALEDALGTARQGAQDSVSIVKGESVAPMAGDTDIDTGMDMDMDAGGDADIEGGDDFGASEPAAGGDEIAGRAER